MSTEHRDGIGDIIKQQRNSIPLTLQQLAGRAGVSASHLGRIERNERFPSARMLRKIAFPLGFKEDELFTLAGYLSTQTTSSERPAVSVNSNQLDPVVARLLAQEPIEVQRQVIGILAILKGLSRTVKDGNGNERTA